MQRSAGVDADQASTTRAHLGDVDGGHAQLVARAGVQSIADVQSTGDLELVCAMQSAGFDDGRLGGGAAHVEGDHVVQTTLACELVRGDHAGRWTGLDNVNWPLAGGARRHDAAVGLHDVHWRVHPDRGQDCRARLVR